MALRTSVLGRFKHLLEVDPDSLESVLSRTRDAPPGEDLTLQPREWERLTQILKHALPALSDPLLRLLAIQHVAEIYEQQMGDPERAFRWWAQVLAGHPFVDEACAELERLAAVMDDWERAVQVYSTVRNKLEPAAAHTIQLREARVQLEQLGQVGKAERIHLSLWQRDRQNPATLAALEAFYIQIGRQAELVKILRQRIDLAETVEERTELRLRLGYLYEVEQGEADLAAECYRAVLREDRLNRQALEAMEQIYLRQERWIDLLSAYERMAATAQGDDERVDYLVRMARICDDALADRGRSRELWQQVLQIRGRDAELLVELAGRFEAMGRWEELAQVLERQAEIATDPAARQRLHEKRGRILGDQLQDPNSALQSWKQVLQSDPDNVQALLALSDLYGDLQASEELRDTLQRLIAVASREGREPELRSSRPCGALRDEAAQFLIDLYRQLARVEEQRARGGGPPPECGPSARIRPSTRGGGGAPVDSRLADAAIDAWGRVLELDAADTAALDALEALLAGQARWQECVEVLERKLQLAGEEQQRVELLLRQAGVWRDGLGDTAAAIESFGRVLQLQPDNETAHQDLCAIYQAEGRFEELLTQILGWLETVDNKRQAVKLLQEAAVVYEEQLGQPDKAFAVWQSAFRQDPQNEVTTSNLERLAGSLRRLEELLAVYDEVVKSTQSAPVKVGLLVSMGRCLGLDLGQLDPAVTLLHDALRMDPEAIPALEVLEECYQRSARWVELVPVLKRHADLERDGGRVVELLRSMAELQSRLGDPAQAMVTFRKVLEIDPGHLSALAALEALYLACGMWEPLTQVLRRQLELQPERAAAIQNQIGEVLDQQLHQPEQAIECYQRVLAVDPENLQAMRALESLYDQTDRGEAYLEMVERQLDLTDSVEDRAMMYRRVAAAWEEQFERPERAMACLEKLLAIGSTSGAEEAHDELERLCRQVGDYEGLVRVLRRHADAMQEPEKRVGLLLALAEVHEVTRLDLEQAVAVHQEALSVAPTDARALLALARLHEKLGQSPEAVAALGRLVPLVEGEQQAKRRDLFFRLGRINQDELGLIDQAEAFYEQALRVDPEHFESMTRLAGIYFDRQEWTAAAEMMVRAEPRAGKQVERAQLLFDAAMINLEQLGQEGQAVELLARTLEVDPDHLRAGLPLSRIYFREERYQELEPVLDMLARKVEPRDRATRSDICFKLGRTAMELGKIDKAIRCFQEARSIDTAHLPTLQALAALQYRTEDWTEAFKSFQTILVHHRPQLSSDEVVQVFHRLGDVKASQGELRKALNFYDKALEQDAGHRPSLEAVAALQARLQNWEAVVRAKTRLLAGAEREQQFELLRECGELHHRRLGRIDAALEAFQAAAALRPDDRVFLNELLELLITAERWNEALQVVLRLTKLEKRPGIRAKFFYNAAVLCREQLDQPEQALQLFNEALDCDPAELRAFEAVDRMCTERRDWPALEQHYRKMIARLSGGDHQATLLAMLWHNLGEVYRTRIKRLPDAIAAFETASRLEPGNLERHTILAELYRLAGPQHAHKAIAEHQALVAHNALHLESYTALHELHAAVGQVDEAWCVASALCYLGRADEEARRFHRQHRHRAPRRARERPSDALWRDCIVYPHQQRWIEDVLGAIAPPLAEMMARPAKDFGLRRRERVKDAGQPLVDLFHHATSVLRGFSVDLYCKSDQQAPLMVANTTGSPSVVVSERLMASTAEKQLAFTLGQQLTFFRPEYFLCRLFPSPSHLRLVLLATLKLANPGLALQSAEVGEVDKLVQQLAEPVHARPGLLQRLAALGQPLAGDPGALDLGPWWTGVGLTANRVGFILCDDLDVAAGAIQAEPAIFGTMPASDKVRELVSYVISPAYFRVRRELGIHVEG